MANAACSTHNVPLRKAAHPWYVHLKHVWTPAHVHVVCYHGRVSLNPEVCGHFAEPWPEGDTSGFRFPVVGKHIEKLRRMTLADLDTVDVRLLAIASQDHWHLTDRMFRAANKKAPDFARFKAEVQRIVGAGSCRFRQAFSATTPALLHAEALHEAHKMQTALLALIPKFRWQQASATAEEGRDVTMRAVGAALLHQDSTAQACAVASRGPETAPAAIRQRGLPANLPDDDSDEVFRKRSLAASNAFESISADVVCTKPPMHAHWRRGL